jgi:2-isopropylmalate synthase
VALISDEVYQPAEVYHLEHLQVTCGDHAIPTATVSLRAPDGTLLVDSAHGTGPGDAVYEAINRIVKVPNELTEFTVQSVTEGIDAQGQVTIRIEAEADGDSPLATNLQTGERRVVFTGHGTSTDIIVASGRAYMTALNKLLALRNGIKV